jgi:hypothetical protein
LFYHVYWPGVSLQYLLLFPFGTLLGRVRFDFVMEIVSNTAERVVPNELFSQWHPFCQRAVEDIDVLIV